MASTQERLSRIEKDLRDLKALLQTPGKGRRKVSLRGALKGTRISPEEIEAAERSLALRPQSK